MSTLALVFMLASWSFVLGLTAWSFHRVLRSQADVDRRREQDSDPDTDGRASSGGVP